jgi:hypothetical protein
VVWRSGVGIMGQTGVGRKAAYGLAAPPVERLVRSDSFHRSRRTVVLAGLGSAIYL